MQMLCSSDCGSLALTHSHLVQLNYLSLNEHSSSACTSSRRWFITNDCYIQSLHPIFVVVYYCLIKVTPRMSINHFITHY